MNAEGTLSLGAAAAEDFNRHENRGDGLHVLASLAGGLTVIREALYARVHADVERRVGMDSMIFPLSEEKSERTTKVEIEIYQIVVAASTAKSCGYVSDEKWFRDWLVQLRMGWVDPNSRAARRITYYATKPPNEQRLAFSNVLAAAQPEAARSPLVLLRLTPWAVQIATALAFGKSSDAQKWRHEQVEILPSILDCHHCHGKLLENGEQCAMCGNPLWTYEWLTAADE